MRCTSTVSLYGTPAWRLALSGLLVILCSNAVRAGFITFTYSGTFTSDITVGGSTISSGSPFSGTLTYDVPQSGTATPFFSGTQSVFGFSSLTLTVPTLPGHVTEGAGQLGLYNDVNPPASTGVSPGDSFYTFVPGIPGNSPGPSSGSINGVTPNFIYLGFVDSSGTAFTGSGLPSTLNLSAFNEAFLGVNYGPLGTGNIDQVFTITSLSGPVAVPEPSSLTILAAGLSVLSFWTILRKKQRKTCGTSIV